MTKEKPILFSAPMVSAILDGNKTQTRRAVKPQPEIKDIGGIFRSLVFHTGHLYPNAIDEILGLCPYGIQGDRLYVKETFYAFGRWETRFSEKKGRDEWQFIDMTLECDRAYQYAADCPDVPLAIGRGTTPGWHKRPSLFMPRHASRITLEVTGVRMERLNTISEEDALAEGITYNQLPNNGLDPAVARRWYRNLWEKIHGTGSWDKNPLVWVISFEVVSQ